MKSLGTYPLETCHKAAQAFLAYSAWKQQTSLQIFKSEIPLVSQKHRFGGTLDAILVQNKLSLGDWKTSNAIYQDHIIQVCGAYALLWEENFPDKPIEGGFHILRFSKDGGFAHHWWNDIPEAKRAFLLMRELYDLDSKLKKLI